MKTQDTAPTNTEDFSENTKCALATLHWKASIPPLSY